MGKNRQKNKYTAFAIQIVTSTLVGAIGGGLIVLCLKFVLSEGYTTSDLILNILQVIGIGIVAFFLQVIIHELGHLVFGLLTGYRFSSFRIGNIMLLKENERIKIKRLSIAGTGGQCLLLPPKTIDEKKPFLLYYLGGSIANLVSSFLFFLLFLFLKGGTYLPMSLLILSIVGIALALLNGIPMNLGLVNNDGYNARLIFRNNEALNAFYIQLKLIEQISQGVRLKDMPEEWFPVLSVEEMDNNMLATLGIFTCNRLIDKRMFKDADQLMIQLLEVDSVAGVHRGLLICDRIYCELIGENRKDVLDIMLDKEQQQFMKSMKTFPAILRTKYAYALLAERDVEKAEIVMRTFKKVARRYPYSCDIESERELMGLAILNRSVH